MIFQELLKKVNIKNMVKHMRRIYLSEQMSAREQELLYRGFKEKLLAITPVIDKNNVLLGCWIRDSFDSSSIPTIEILVYHKDEIMRFRDDVFSDASMQDPDTLSDDEIVLISDNRGRILGLRSDRWKETHKDAKPWAVPEVCLEGYCFDFSEWEDILGWEVDIDNVNMFGKDLFAGYVLWEMAFNGMDEKSHDERLNELKERVEEMEEIFELPKEEWDKHFVKAEDVFKDLSLDSDFEEIRKETRKELEENKIKIKRDSLWNVRSTGISIRNYIQSSNL